MSTKAITKLEICIDSIASALAAQRGGAHRVELCDNLLEGGTTPSLGMIKTVRKLIDIDLFVLIRPRGGDFLYSDEEFLVMKEDIRLAKEAGADGVVMGVLNSDGSVDVERTEILQHLARPMQVTFHRAFDLVPEPFVALEEIIISGCDRILTSGQQNSALEGAGLIQSLIDKAAGRIGIMPGAGIHEKNIGALIKACGASEYHMSLRSPMTSNMRHNHKTISLSIDGVDDSILLIADEQRIQMVNEILMS